MDRKPDIPRRAAGVLLPVSSLPCAYGIGAFGKEARNWIDFLRRAGQQYWQVLPLGPTSFGDSPYQSFSAFAGNPYFIDLDTLQAEGLLQPDEYRGIDWGEEPGRVDYSALYKHREAVLRKAYARFEGWEQLRIFREEHAQWLEDYALYMAVKATQGQKAWYQWEAPLRLRLPAALAECGVRLRQDIEYHVFVQYLFFTQWNALRRYANERGVQVIGDIPIYVAMDSADVWANRELFELGEEGGPAEVSGCPPDSFAPEGQLWGNPLYNWPHMAQTGYAWWICRLRASFALYDVLRIDHFRGLESYYAIPAGHADACFGVWKPGPGMDLIDAIQAGVPEARIIAEDLGFLTDDVRQLLAKSGYPGMKVLQFAFDSREESDYSPYNYGYNNVVFTGTHDNDTMAGWAETAPAKDVEHAMEYVNIGDKKELPRAFIRLAMQSGAALAMVPLQDWLGLGSEARMNIPSTLGGNNWRWRALPGACTAALAQEMLDMTKLYGRHGD